MAEYDNPEIPEGINVSPTHPLKEFALLVGGISALVIVAVLVLSLLAGTLARHVPFAQEQALAESLSSHWTASAKPSAVEQQRQAYLQALADRLVAVMPLPEDMRVRVHYAPGETVNAMATLGGHIIVFQGLIDTLPNENALAMVLAHEIAHIRHRHPIVAMGRGFTVALALSSLAGIGDGVMQDWIGGLGLLPVLSFSRSQEEVADGDALQAMQQLYGHVEGAASFFEYVARQTPALSSPDLFNTHPGDEKRIERIRHFQRSHPAPTNPPLVALPAFMGAREAGKAKPPPSRTSD